jgi:glucoamylase
LAAGRDPKPFIRAMEGFASSTGLLPEQIWDAPDRPEVHMLLGGPTGAAMPLMWAHAEYIKLLRSAQDGRAFDFLPEVSERYQGQRKACVQIEIWKFNRQVREVKRGFVLRIQAGAAFRLQWSCDGRQSVQNATSTSTALGVEFVDIPVSNPGSGQFRFTFFWPGENRWEGREFEVDVVP